MLHFAVKITLSEITFKRMVTIRTVLFFMFHENNFVADSKTVLEHGSLKNLCRLYSDPWFILFPKCRF